MKRILAIMGSPRKNGNTARLLKGISELVPESCDMEIIDLNEYQINGCRGCSCCQQNTEKFECVQKDDMNPLLQKIINADAVLYASPLYGHNYSGQMKIFLDRHIPLFKFVGGKDKSVDQMEIVSAIANKPVGLMVSCQGPEENNTELIKMLFEKFCESSLAHCAGTYIFPFCNPDAPDARDHEETLRKIRTDILRLIEKAEGRKRTV